ncbi:MAG: nitroreductase family protein [Desulfitobacteriaceae bacterium]|nr:nitroreductase family protein [Desulfitobacteriaceae bacterium]MDD4345531.1 nitroreductase family protein [Desulfitobacteriaceae bacterium]MDD4401660.1 nitroreductase family protein [Desulfitobacteriaceae bacterium]
MNDFYKVIMERRSIRKFKPDPIPKEVLERIIKLGMWAPSAMNTQPWEFYVFSNAARERIGEILGKSYKNITPRLKELFLEKMQNIVRYFFSDMGGAPTIILVLSKKLPVEQYQQGAIQSCAAAIQNLLLAAHIEGLGACWMTGPLWVEEEVLAYLGRQDDARMVAAIPIGYPDQTPPTPLRKHETIHWLED